jgi:hypothetical protein
MNSAIPLCTLTRRDRQAGSMRRHLRNGRHNMGLQRAKGRWQKVGGCSAMSRQRAMAMASQWWNVVPKGCVRGFWWSTMSANVGIPAHTSISFSGLAGSRRVHVHSFKKERALRNGCCPVVTFAGGGGCWWSTMSEQTEITAHPPIYFFGHGSPRGPCDICPGVVGEAMLAKTEIPANLSSPHFFFGHAKSNKTLLHGGHICRVGVLIFNHVNEN